MTEHENVIKGPFPHKERSAAQSVLDAASSIGLMETIVIGLTANNDVYLAATNADPRDLLYLLEKVRFQILKSDDGEDGETE